MTHQKKENEAPKYENDALVRQLQSMVEMLKEGAFAGEGEILR